MNFPSFAKFLPRNYFSIEELGINAGLWFAILALISTLTVNYVTFINRLKESYHSTSKEEWDYRIEKRLRNISWTADCLLGQYFFMLITVGAGHEYNFYLFTDLYPSIWACPQQFLLDIVGS